MSIRTTIVLAIVVALLGSLYYFGEKVKAPEEEGDRPPLLKDVKADDVTALDVTVGGKSLTLEKKDGLWIVTSPFKGLANNRNTQNLVNQLAEMKADRIVNEDSGAGIVKQYGLDKPQFIVKMHLKGSKETPSVSFGIRSPSETGWYAQVDGKGRVLLAGNSIAADIVRAPNGWREPAPLPVDSTKVDRLVATGDGTDLEISKVKDKEEWQMEKPRKGKADLQAITGWLLKLQNGQVQKYFEKMKADDPQLKLTYTLKIWNKDQRDPMTLQVGAPTAGGVYAVRSAAGVTEVFLLPQPQVASVKIDTAEVADKHMFDLEIEKAAKAEILEVEAGEASAEKSGGAWAFTKPAAQKDDLGKVAALLYSLKDLKYERRVSDPKDLEKARAALQKPKARFVVSDDKGTKLVSLVVADGAPNSRSWVQGNGDDVYIADASFANDWKANITAVKNAGAAPSGMPASSGAPAAATSGAPASPSAH